MLQRPKQDLSSISLSLIFRQNKKIISISSSLVSFSSERSLLRYIHYIPIWNPTHPVAQRIPSLKPVATIAPVHPARASPHPGFPEHRRIPQERYSCPDPPVPSSPDIRAASLPPWPGSIFLKKGGSGCPVRTLPEPP